MNLTGRKALVTGSSKGIGAAIALGLARAGASVAIHGNSSPDDAARVAAKIREMGLHAPIVLGDLADAPAPARIVAQAFEALSGLDILINNAAATAQATVTELTAELIDKEMAINFRAVVLATGEFARLTTSPHGRVINISSIGGHTPTYARSIYSAAKAAVDSFTRTAALELGERGITVNAVAPGTTETDLYRQRSSGLSELFARWTALKRIGQPDDIADVVTYLASDGARWLTGNIIAADGGMMTTGSNLARFSS